MKGGETRSRSHLNTLRISLQNSRTELQRREELALPPLHPAEGGAQMSVQGPGQGHCGWGQRRHSLRYCQSHLLLF